MFNFLDTKVKKKQLTICYSVFLFNGMLALSVGSMLPFIRDARGLDYAFAGMIVSLHSVGNFLSSFFAGPLAIALGRKKSIVIFESALPIDALYADITLIPRDENRDYIYDDNGKPIIIKIKDV